jgi:hypothetical protein
MRVGVWAVTDPPTVARETYSSVKVASLVAGSTCEYPITSDFAECLLQDSFARLIPSKVGLQEGVEALGGEE